MAAVTSVSHLDVRYLTSAGKPLRIRTYRGLPRPGAVIGDQVATDGVLAWRLGYSFVHYRPQTADIPLGPRLMRYLGLPIQPFLFQDPLDANPKASSLS
ncbi:MAG: hypothetical protein ACRDNF_00065 [Streptosporangiaceae bacterium]